MKEIKDLDLSSSDLTEKLKLLPSQEKVSFPIILRLYQKMAIGLSLPSIKVKEGMIVDGHHRYIASVMANVEVGEMEWDCNKQPSSWDRVEVLSKDYDTLRDIQIHNEKDAEMNMISVQELERRIADLKLG